MSERTSLAAIMAALKTMIESAFPGAPVHLEVTPVDFDRPAFLLESGKIKPLPFSRSDLLMQLQVKISAFAEVNDYYDGQFADLYNRLDALLALFARQYVPVGDRAIKFSKPPEGEVPGRDYAEVILYLEWTEARSAFPPAEEASPVIEKVSIRQQHITVP